ncbi:MAG: hypothetical protein D6761_09220 [Candidatus Dadabacteria bacterium]|nr:MAG: hypothetical protein D6761_09220 [Candidatus Dadabacteria bacterium]
MDARQRAGRPDERRRQVGADRKVSPTKIAHAQTRPELELELVQRAGFAGQPQLQHRRVLPGRQQRGRGNRPTQEVPRCHTIRFERREQTNGRPTGQRMVVAVVHRI